MGYSPDVDRQTPVRTVPSRRTTYAGGNEARGGGDITLHTSLPFNVFDRVGGEVFNENSSLFWCQFLSNKF